MTHASSIQRILFQQAFDRLGNNILTSGRDNQVFFSIGDSQEALPIETANITSV
jgi:hypothetical protein